jgi:hypothetical protein
MAEPTAGEIASRITQELASTKFACSTLVPLSGGTANFTFKGTLVNPDKNGISNVVVKHGEGFVAQHPALKLSTLRCVRPTDSTTYHFTSVHFGRRSDG